MNGLKTSRVVVIDDLREEALPVIEALGQLGIGCIYVPGERIEDLPKKPFRGVRLVVLDMRLGITGGDKQTAGVTANVFARTVSPDDGPLIVLLWTKHKEDVPAFKTALFAIEPKFKSNLLIADLEKPANVSRQTRANLKGVLKKLAHFAKEWAPVDFFWFWEQLNHDAATGTVGMLARHVSACAEIGTDDDEDQRKAKWLAALNHLLRSLAHAAGGRNANENTAKEDLLEALTAIHEDRLSLALEGLPTDGFASLFSQPHKKLNKEQAAELNGMLMLGSVSQKSQPMRPGNVYYYTSEPGAFRPCTLDSGRLMAEVIVRLEKDAEYKKHSDLANKHKADAEKSAVHLAARDNQRALIHKQCHAIMVEITPTCDYSQRSRHVVRLVGGVLVPNELINYVPSDKESLRILEQVRVPNLEGVWALVLSGRCLISIPEVKKFQKTSPAFRLRAQVLTDLRNWCAAQSARSGYISVAS